MLATCYYTRSPYCCCVATRSRAKQGAFAPAPRAARSAPSRRNFAKAGSAAPESRPPPRESDRRGRHRPTKAARGPQARASPRPVAPPVISSSHARAKRARARSRAPRRLIARDARAPRRLAPRLARLAGRRGARGKRRRAPFRRRQRSAAGELPRARLARCIGARDEETVATRRIVAPRRSAAGLAWSRQPRFKALATLPPAPSGLVKLDEAAGVSGSNDWLHNRAPVHCELGACVRAARARGVARASAFAYHRSSWRPFSRHE